MDVHCICNLATLSNALAFCATQWSKQPVIPWHVPWPLAKHQAKQRGRCSTISMCSHAVGKIPAQFPISAERALHPDTDTASGCLLCVHGHLGWLV